MDRLTNTVRPYAWGSTTAIPELLGTPPPANRRPRLWMGAHPGAPSRIDRGRRAARADRRHRRRPGGRTRPAHASPTFGPRLPFLLKLLAAASPLSLQVHPDLATGPRRATPTRRPAASRVDAPAPQLQGRQPQARTDLRAHPLRRPVRLPPRRRRRRPARRRSASTPSSPYVDLLRAHPETAALREVLTAVLTADRAEMAATVARPRGRRRTRSRGRPAYAAYAADRPPLPRRPRRHRGDAAQPRRAAARRGPYLGAGVPHAYLDGLGVEIMANSDNVLRCGLTPKHIDVPELLRVVRFEADRPRRPAPRGPPRRRGALRDAHRRVPPLPLPPRRRRPRRRPSTCPRRPADPAVHRGAGRAPRPDDDADDLGWPPADPPSCRLRRRSQCPGEGTLFRATVAGQALTDT